MKYFKLSLPLILLLLTAFQCEEDEEFYSHQEPIQFSVKPNDSIVYVGDTLWLNGCVTSQVLEYETGDSVFSYAPPMEYMYFYKMKNAASYDSMNTMMAANSFLFKAVKGEIKVEDEDIIVESYWEELQRLMIPVVSSDSCFFSVRIGVVPVEIGYFALKSSDGFLVEDHHLLLYDQFGDADEYSFYAQGRSNVFRAKVTDSFYFFKVVDR